jgi:hypothetical protein
MNTTLIDYYRWQIERRHYEEAVPGLRDSIREAAEVTDRNPSEEQRQAGNYRKGRFRWNGLEIAIENPRGSVRRGRDRDGNSWHITMPHHYGYIKQHISEADGDHVDCFMGNSPESETVYVVDQLDPKTRSFDEAKCMLGFPSEHIAKTAYESAYRGDWQGFGAITPMTVPEFKRWLESGDTSKPVAGGVR